MKTRNVILVIAIICIVAVIGYFELQKPDISDIDENVDIIIESGPIGNINEQSATTKEPKVKLTEEDKKRIATKARNYVRAKELVSPDGYINTNSITLQEHVGKNILLVDFWTYSCINCQRTLPYVTSWYEKYKDEGLVIIGVHTPEFGFEEKYDNVLKATEKWGITYPVVQDNAYKTWRAYNNRYWPRKYLIDIDGFIVYDHIGEGGYEETERVIQELLEERNEVLGLDGKTTQELSQIKTIKPESHKIQTPELYLGYGFERNQMGNKEGWQPNKVIEYGSPDTFIENKFHLEGMWKNNKDNMEVISQKGKIILPYTAKVVNIVAGSNEKKEITVLLDGKKTNTISISNFDLYTIVESKDYSEHMLELEIPQGVMVYTFTFG